MDLSIGRIRLRIIVHRLSEKSSRWEQCAAAGMDDHELSRINLRNTREYEGAPWHYRTRDSSGGRRP